MAAAMVGLAAAAVLNVLLEVREEAGVAREPFVVGGLRPGPCWFALKTYGRQPDQSDLSNVVKAVVK